MGLKSAQIKKIAGIPPATITKFAAEVEPRVYVGTYGKYNSGRIDGAWLDLQDYADAEDFYEAAKELHKDEADPELMFQDWEGIPDWAIGESWIESKYFEYLDYAKNWDEDQKDAFEQFIEYYYGSEISKLDDIDDAMSEFEERYQGKYDSVEDYARQIIDDMGGVSEIQNKEYHFDIESFARDLGFEGWNYVTMLDVEDNPDEYPEGEGTYDPSGEFYSPEPLDDVVREWLDDGLISGEQIENYFDYESYAQDLELGGDIYFIDGHVFSAY